MNSRSEIDELKARTDLLAIIRAKVELKREGKEWKGLCPFHAEKTPSFFVIPHKKIFHCFGCSATGDVFEWLKRTENLDFKGAVAYLRRTGTQEPTRFTSASAAAVQMRDDAENIRRRIHKARSIWNEGIPATGTIVERYLASRGITGIVIPPTIRFHPKLWNRETNGLLPGMIAAITDSRQQIIGIHRTYLRSDGRGKADVATAKKMLGEHRNAHVWLSLPSCNQLAIAEGIETALSVMIAKPDLCVWAALSLGNMNAKVPPSIKELFLCADGDNKDPKAAEAVLQAAVRRHQSDAPGRIIRIVRPEPGKDFNDMVRGTHEHAQPSYGKVTKTFEAPLSLGSS